MRKRSGFEAWWIAVGLAIGGGVGLFFQSLPIGAGLGAIAGLAVALVRASRGWRTGHELEDEQKQAHRHDRRHSR